MIAFPSSCEVVDAELATGLALVARLVGELSNARVQYCHWKSNRKLNGALNGEDDLDLLISMEDKARAEGIFLRLGFKNFVQVPAKRFNGITDFIGFDSETGKLVHLHTHYRLTLGEHILKGYQLPWQKKVLETAEVAEQKIPIVIANPECEILLLVIRTCLKIWFWNRIFPKTLERTLVNEFHPDLVWLRSQINEHRFQELCEDWLGTEIWPLVRTVVLTKTDKVLILGLRSLILKRMSEYRTYNGWETNLRRAVRGVSWGFGMVNKRFLNWPRPWGRVPTSGGRIVCIIGADGSGKSTLTREIEHWLKFKIDAISVYMGSGDGRNLLFLTALKKVRRLLLGDGSGGRWNEAPSGNLGTRDRTDETWLLRSARLTWGVVLALEKRKKLRRTFRASARGMVVIADRYPQSQYFDFNDGPILQDFASARWGVLRAIAKWELNSYRISERVSPDLVIKLMVPIETALNRKPEMRREEIDRRNKAVGRLKFSERTRIVTISADLPWEEVFQRAKRDVWSTI